MPRKNFLSTIRTQMKDAVLSGPPYDEFYFGLKKFIDGRYKRPAHVYGVVKKIARQNTDRFAQDYDFENAAKRIMHETKEQYWKSQKTAQKAVERRNEDVTSFTTRYVEAVIAHCEESDNVADWIIALQIAVGCRQRDLFEAVVSTSGYFAVEFLPLPQENEILQMGSSKAPRLRSACGSDAARCAMRKTLVGLSSRRFLYILAKLRHYYTPPPRSAVAETNRWNARLCKLSRFYFPIRQERSGTHVNRAIHAALVRSKSHDASAPRAVQKELGHQSMSSSLHYLYVEIDDENGFEQELVD
jgi:hypothetical protein